MFPGLYVLVLMSYILCGDNERPSGCPCKCVSHFETAFFGIPKIILIDS